MLQLLYPCSRFSPDRCLICGGNFRDHLTLWWSKNLYKPLDRILDDTYRTGVRIVDGKSAPASDAQPPPHQKGRRRQPSRKARLDATRYMPRAPSQSIEYAYHWRYVVEVLEKSGRSSNTSGKRVRVLVPRSEVGDPGTDEPQHPTKRRRPTARSRGTPRRGSGLRRVDEERRRSGTSTDMSSSSSSSSSSSAMMLRDKYVVRMPPATDLRNTSALLVMARAFTSIALDSLLELEASDEARAASQQQRPQL
jgi:hypothetical protein